MIVILLQNFKEGCECEFTVWNNLIVQNIMIRYEFIKGEIENPRIYRSEFEVIGKKFDFASRVIMHRIRRFLGQNFENRNSSGRLHSCLTITSAFAFHMLKFKDREPNEGPGRPRESNLSIEFT